MGDDASGDVNYTEFAEQLHKMKSHDAHTLLVFIKFYVTEIKRKLEEKILNMEKDLIREIDTALSKTTEFDDNSNKKIISVHGQTREPASGKGICAMVDGLPPVLEAHAQIGGDTLQEKPKVMEQK